MIVTQNRFHPPSIISNHYIYNKIIVMPSLDDQSCIFDTYFATGALYNKIGGSRNSQTIMTRSAVPLQLQIVHLFVIVVNTSGFLGRIRLAEFPDICTCTTVPDASLCSL